MMESSFEICLDGQNITQKISDWSIKSKSKSNSKDKSDTLYVKVTYLSGKSYTAIYGRYSISPCIKLQGSHAIIDGNQVRKIEDATLIGDKYVLYQYAGNKTEKYYIKQKSDFAIVEVGDLKSNRVFKYFLNIIDDRLASRHRDAKNIYNAVKQQADQLTGYSDTALNAYLTGTSKRRLPPDDLIFPFGINASQLDAIRGAFSSQISIIEGPPGTGKTQTILNIIANILLQGKSVAIISTNNDAVTNVYHKMEAEGFGYLIAKLGSGENIKDFFTTLKLREALPPPSDESVDLVDLKQSTETLSKLFSARINQANLNTLLGNLKTEQLHYNEWVEGQLEDSNDKSTLTNLEFPLLFAKWKAEQVVGLVTFLRTLPSGKISIRNRFRLFFWYHLWRLTSFQSIKNREDVTSHLQYLYYEKAITETAAKIEELSAFLEENEYENRLDEVTKKSMTYLKHHLAQRRFDGNDEFSQKDYKQKFTEFIKRYPIIGSSSFSLEKSLGQGNFLDYLIVDEASQQDIVPGFIGLGVAKNAVIVGDSKQLQHIAVKTGVMCPEENYDCWKYSLLDSIIRVFRDQVPTTLLKEHYRCHPKIIQFCNKQFYDNSLVPIREDANQAALKLVVTAKGNHTRGNSNVRELESYMDVSIDTNVPCGYGENTATGFIAPFNQQVNIAEEYLSQKFVRSTIHKFQGRECDTIVFSTVLDKKRENTRKVDFVDDPYLVNVAVSRAKEQFVLVTGNEVFERNNGSIAALIRYIRYNATVSDIIESNVISSFDLLYSEYDKSLDALRKRLNPNDSKWKSEQIVATHLRDILGENKYSFLAFHHDVRLKQIVSKSIELTQEESNFIRSNSHCDFLISYKVGNENIAVIEVDGSQHDVDPQKHRDVLKNGILKKAGLPLLRLKTVDAHVEERITQFLDKFV